MLHSSFFMFRYGELLEDIGAEVEVNPDDQVPIFISVYRYIPGVFPTGLWGIRYSLHYLLLFIDIKKLSA